jgi:crossover junction endodeoxyribonuclease RuvC
MIKIVGIDPGLAATGVGVVSGRGVTVAGYSFGCITTSHAIPLAERLDRIFSRLQQLFSDETPDLVVLEDVFSLREYPKSGIALGQVSGVVMLASVRAGLRCVQIPVREAKQVLSGNGNASKAQLETAVRRHLKHPDPIRPFHAADALGLALIGLFRCGLLPQAASAASTVRRLPNPVPRRRSLVYKKTTALKGRTTP